jgi:cytochrome c biogenesis protein CcdA
MGFGLGFRLPLLALLFLSGATQRWLTRQFAQRAQLINVVGSTLLVSVGVYDLWSNWELIRTFPG